MSEEGGNARTASAKNWGNRFVDRFVDFLFSKNSRKWVLLIILLGFVLRIIISSRAEFGADEMVHGTHAIGFIESGKLQIMDQDAVWFFLMDLSMKIFGVTVFGLRFLSIILGTLSILLVYSLGKELFSENAGIIAAIILAVSPFQLLQTVALMDIPMAFFAMLAVYLLILFFKTRIKYYFVFSWLSLGIAIMIKQIAIMFVPALAIFLLYYNKKHHGSYKFKQLAYAAVIILLMVLPVLTFNYLLFKDKGITDVQFARFTQKGMETYAGIAGTMEPFTFYRAFMSYNDSMPGIINGLIKFYYSESLIVLIFTLLGLFFFFREKNDFKLILILSFLFPYIFLSGTSLLSNHLIFGTFFISLFASLGITKIFEKIRAEKARKYLLYAIVLLILMSAVWAIQTNIGTKGFFGLHHMEKLIEFKNSNIEKDALVVVDSRIYRGRIVFMFNDRHYLESNYFPELLAKRDSLSGQPVQVPTYFIEAVTDDSGWGTVKDQPEFNQSTENIVSLFKSQTQLVETINDIWGKPHFNVYKTTTAFKSSVLAYADATHEWFFYPVGYKPVTINFDYYEVYNTFDSLLDKFAHMVLYLEVALAIMLMLYLCHLFYRNS